MLTTLQLVAEGAAFRLPHDCEFGMAVRASELWGKALGAVLQQVQSRLAAAHSCHMRHVTAHSCDCSTTGLPAGSCGVSCLQATCRYQPLVSARSTLVT